MLGTKNDIQLVLQVFSYCCFETNFICCRYLKNRQSSQSIISWQCSVYIKNVHLGEIMKIFEIAFECQKHELKKQFDKFSCYVHAVLISGFCFHFMFMTTKLGLYQKQTFFCGQKCQFTTTNFKINNYKQIISEKFKNCKKN